MKIATRSQKKSRQAICKNLIKAQTAVRKSHQVNGKNLVKLSFAWVSFVDRMTEKSSTLYISALANENAGSIYFGIKDDGIVKGEFIEKKIKKN